MKFQCRRQFLKIGGSCRSAGRVAHGERAELSNPAGAHIRWLRSRRGIRPRRSLIPLIARITELGGTVVVTSPAEFASFIAKDVEKWGNVIRTAKIKPDQWARRICMYC
jgi:hypothetical protein